MKRLFVLMCLAGLSACATQTPMPAWTPPASQYATPSGGYNLGAMEVERVPFRAGVSSTTVEKMAMEQGCMGTSSQGAGLMTPQGPVEIYRMICDSGRAFLARCEFRQCRAMAAPPAGGYASSDGPRGANRGRLGAREVPRLSISWACRDCKTNELVPGLINAAYQRSAQAAGFKVSGAETATVSIVQFNERQAAMRAMLGKMAGADMIATQTEFRGERSAAQDSASESTMNIDMVSEHIGQQTFQQLAPKPSR